MRFAGDRRFILFLLVLLFFSVGARPASENSSGWVVELAEEGFAERSVTPVTVRPLELKPVPKIFEPLEAMPPRMEREIEKREALQEGILAPSFIPQAFLQKDTSAGGIRLLAPAKLKSFKGLSETRYFPADPVIAAGPRFLIVATNSAVGIYKKRGKQVADIKFSSWFDNVPEAKGASLFDPKVLYDQYAGHFILLVDAVRSIEPTGAWYLLSVSKTDDPRGEWSSWALDMKLNGTRKSNNWADFPGLGIDETSIYMTGNMFNLDTDSFAYAKLRIVKKAEVYAFGPITFFDRWKLKDADGNKVATVQPVHSFGPASVEYLVSCDEISDSKITLWRIPSPADLKPILKKKSVAVNSYLVPPDAHQKGVSVDINTGGADFRNAAFFKGSIYTAHAIAHNWGTGQVSALRFYELSDEGRMRQQITYGADKLFYFYPSVTVDSRGNVILVFNRSSASEFVGVYFTGRKSTDAVGKLQQPSAALKVSDSHYLQVDSSDRNRWGDYTGIALDPDDSIWITGELASSTARWKTQIGRVRY